MTRPTPAGLCRAALAFSLAIVLASAGVGADRASAPKTIRIGMVGTLFRDIPEPMIQVLMQPFGTLMQTQTGVSGELIKVGSAEKLGQQLADNQVELGVFHGFEFAWARQQHPGLQPLMIAVNQQHHLRALLVVRKESAAATWADLQGKRLALPKGTREHCRLFLERHCQELGCEAAHFFAEIATPANVEEALDKVVDDAVQAAVVDNISLERFQRRKPGRFARLKTLAESEVFPAAVVAYRPGAIDAELLQRFRTGMLNASDTALGRQLLTLWKLSGFEAVPADYETTLKAIAKAYPPPIGSKTEK
jgi:ABC-type phosphate/phosphonate transport system substrate-binding protein